MIKIFSFIDSKSKSFENDYRFYDQHGQRPWETFARHLFFKSFLQLPLDQPCPDYFTFSRFRSRFSRDAMIKINSTFLKTKEWLKIFPGPRS